MFTGHGTRCEVSPQERHQSEHNAGVQSRCTDFVHAAFALIVSLLPKNQIYPGRLFNHKRDQLHKESSMESAYRTILTRLLVGLTVVALLTGIGWTQAGTGQLA